MYLKLGPAETKRPAGPQLFMEEQEDETIS
jgi:hypothetical protein